MIVGITGVTGNMGSEALRHLLLNNKIDRFRLFILNGDKNLKRVKSLFNKNRNRLEFVYGNLKYLEDVKRFCKGLDYVINMAAVIPPKSDKDKQAAIDCNQTGVYNLVKVIEGMAPQPRFIHTSTVALYGNRTEAHPYGIVGDPLLVSPFDIYSLTKLRGEFRVLESKIEKFAVLRQSAMLHKYMLMDNISDGLMFHTCFNSPLEWVTASDSGRLIANIIKKDMEEDLTKTFWNRVFNIGAPKENRITGFDTLDDGFKLMGGSTKKMFKPDYNATRNFHGMWFYDGHKLDDLFHYQTETCKDYWRQIGKKHWYYWFGRLVSQSLISKMVIQSLFKDDNSIKYWYNHKDLPRMYATFKGMEEYEKIGTDWSTFKLLKEDPNYEEIRDIEKTKLIDYGFDINKDLSLINEDDIKNIASLHGGKVLEEFKGLYTPIKFVNSDNEEFMMKPYSLICGHWLNITYKEFKWDFDRLSKKDKIYASIWYDSHDKDEDKLYSFDAKFNAHMEDIK